MALSTPLPISQFANQLRIDDVKFVLGFAQQNSRSGGGARLSADLAPAGWRAEVTTVLMEHWEAEGIMAILNSRGGGIRSLYLYNNKLPYPIDDPDGSIFGTATPAVGAISNLNSVAFTGFPAGYVLRAGTYFQVVFDGSRRYLGQFAQTRTADGAGAVTATTIAPTFPASIAPGDAVTVIKPAGKFKLVAGSAYPSVSDVVHSRVTFSAEQTYEA